MDGIVDRLMQRVHPIAERAGQVCRLRDLDIGLRLADDASHIFPAVHGTLVARAVDVAFAASGDAADIITQSGIAYRFSAHTVFDKALVVSADTAGVGGDPRRLCGQAVEEIQKAAGVDVVKLETRVDTLRVDIAAAVTGNQRAVVYAADSADLAQAGHGCRAPAARDNSGYFVAADQTAGLQFSRYRPAERAVQDAAPVQSHQAAGHVVVPAGYDDTGHREVFHDGVHAGLQEESAGGQRIAQAHIKNAVPASVEAAVEKRNRLEIHVREREVVVQHNRQMIRPGIQGAVLRKRDQVLHRADMQHFLVVVRFRPLQIDGCARIGLGLGG